MTKKNNAIVNASKQGPRLTVIGNIDAEDEYDSELDEKAELRENAYLGNIFIMQELDHDKDFDYEVSFVEGDYRPIKEVMKRKSTALERLEQKKKIQKDGKKE